MPIEWDRVEREINFYENHCTFEMVTKIYDSLLVDNQNVGVYSVFAQKHSDFAMAFGLQMQAMKGQRLGSHTLESFHFV